MLQTANLLPQFQLLPGTTHTNRQQLLIREHSHIHDLDTPPHSQFCQYLCHWLCQSCLCDLCFCSSVWRVLKQARICPFSGSLVLHAAVRTYLSPACVCVRVMCRHVCVCVCVCAVCARCVCSVCACVVAVWCCMRPCGLICHPCACDVPPRVCV